MTLSTPRLILCLLACALLAGCGRVPSAPAALRPTPQRAMKLREAAPAPALRADRLKLSADAGGHHVEIAGAAGAVTGMGVWGSPGVHASPAAGEEATAAADGSFALELHVHSGEQLTLWAYVDQGERRIYSTPVVLAHPGAARAAR